MSAQGIATLGRRRGGFDRLDLALGGAIVGGVIGTLAVVAIPDFHGHVVAPAADLAFHAIALVVTTTVAALSWIRYRESRQPMALVQAAAFLALAIADVMAVALAMSGDLQSAPAPAAMSEDALFVWTAARLLAGGLLVVGGLESLRGGRPRYPLLFVLGVVAFMAAVIGAVLVLGDRLTSLLAYPVPDDRPSEPVDLALTAAGVVVHLVGAALFLGAAAVGRRLWRRDGSVGGAYLALGLLVAAFAGLHGSFFPSLHPEQVSTADLLWLACYVVLFMGIQAEARAVMGGLRSANDLLARLRDAEGERAALEERARLSRELHDGLAQDLWLAKLKLGRLAAAPDLSPAARVLADEATRAVDISLADARQALLALRDVGQASESFGDLLDRYVGDLEDRFGMAISCDSSDELPQLAPRAQADALRVIQEALSNAARHADAHSVRVRAVREGTALVLSVTDDGIGFAPASVEGGRVGLLTMRERAALIGADLEVDSEPGAGTRIVLTIPAPALEEGGGQA